MRFRVSFNPNDKYLPWLVEDQAGVRHSFEHVIIEAPSVTMNEGPRGWIQVHGVLVIQGLRARIAVDSRRRS